MCGFHYASIPPPLRRYILYIKIASPSKESFRRRDMPKLTRENWKGLMWVGAALFIETTICEIIITLIKGFSNDRFWATGFQMTLYIFFFTLGVLKYKGASRWLTLLLTIGATTVSLITCILISYYFHKAA